MASPRCPSTMLEAPICPSIHYAMALPRYPSALASSRRPRTMAEPPGLRSPIASPRRPSAIVSLCCAVLLCVAASCEKPRWFDVSPIKTLPPPTSSTPRAERMSRAAAPSHAGTNEGSRSRDPCSEAQSHAATRGAHGARGGRGAHVIFFHRS
jgi:hypothetical protein